MHFLAFIGIVLNLLLVFKDRSVLRKALFFFFKKIRNQNFFSRDQSIKEILITYNPSKKNLWKVDLTVLACLRFKSTEVCNSSFNFGGVFLAHFTGSSHEMRVFFHLQKVLLYFTTISVFTRRGSFLFTKLSRKPETRAWFFHDLHLQKGTV